MPKVEFDSEDVFNLSLSLVGLILKSGPMQISELEDYFKMPKKTIIRAARAAGNSEDLLRFQSHFYLDEDLLEDEGIIDFSVIEGQISSVPPLSRSQATALTTGLEYLASLPQFSANKDLEELRSSLSQGISQEVAKSKPHPLESLLSKLRDAIVQEVQVAAKYTNQLGESSERVIDPLRIDFVGKRFYLRGFCRSSNELRSFRLDRISQLQVTEQKINPDSKKAVIPEEVYGSNPGNFEVELEVDPEAFEIFWNFPTAKEPRQQSDGRYRGTIRLGNPAAITRHVARYGGAVRVIAPEAARREVHRFASAVLGFDQVSED